MKKAVFLLILIPTLASADAMTDAAELYFSAKPKEAYERYKKISIETGARDAFLNAAFIALEQNKTKEAVDIMSAAVKLYPADKTILDFWGEAYLADGQFLNAERIYALLAEDKTDAAFYFTKLARAQDGLGESGMAEANFRRAAGAGEQASYSNFMLGRFYERKKDYKAARGAYEKAVDYDSQFIEARYKFAEMLVKNKNYNDARQQFSMVYSIERSPEVKKQMDDAAAKRKQSVLYKKGEAEPSSAPKEISGHTFVKPVVSISENYPVIKVGLGTKGNGAPSVRQKVEFVPAQEFRVYNVKTNKILANGKEKELWSAVIEKGKAYIVKKDGTKIPFSGSIIIKQNETLEAGATIIVKKLMTGAGMTWAGAGDRELRGALEIIHNTSLNTLIPVNHVNVEEYLFGTVPAEMSSTFPLEALKAQAVLSRTYSLKHLGKHKKWGYDVCDTQHCQVHGGVHGEREKINAAVESTAGEVLTYKGKFIEAVFSGNAGGFTQSSKDAGWSKHDYLVPVSDYKDFDLAAAQPYHFKNLLQHGQDAYSAYKNRVISPAAYRWVRAVSVEDLKKTVKKDIGEIKGIIVESRAKSGYISKIRVSGTKGSEVFSKENTIKRGLALGMLRSTYFYVQPVYEKKKLKEFIFFGGGWGHGVGFCQTGAGGRAEGGQDYKTILEHYFTGTRLENIQEDGENK